ncbi:hypothetical protein CPB83DRAFT_882417 [Crepidotus variabilis]|uniref:F-box domain-containing protein n=1 Tax=Crepidotus variabilis TaxID=179855 RepID=A0A9P6EJG0_9AGAR|nr:hypothetical protein CPB83DRAFT_882417 [Crepidotus variabilis]
MGHHQPQLATSSSQAHTNRPNITVIETQDPLLNLPRELISKIFECGYAMDPKGSPLILGAVCCSWRVIAWSTPTIWSSVSFCINPPGLEEFLHARLELLEEYVTRSRALPLSLCVYNDDARRWNQDKSSVESFADILNQCYERWRLLDLHLPKAFLQCLDERKLPRGRTAMKSLSISMSDGASDSLKIELSCSTLYLQNLHLINSAFDLNSLKATFTQLRTILASGSVEAWLSVISSAPLLEEATFLESSSSSTSPSNRGMVHSSLRLLKMSFGSFSEKRRLPFHHITCPNLHTFSINNPSYHFCGDFGLLADNQEQKLTTLDLWNFHSSCTHLEDLLATLPSLENLSIGKPKYISATELFNRIFLRFYRSYSTSSSIIPKSFILPNLQTFHFDGHWFSYDAWPRLRPLWDCQTQVAGATDARNASDHQPTTAPNKWSDFKLKNFSVNLHNHEEIETMKAVTCLDQETLDVMLNLREAGVKVSMSAYGMNACIKDLIQASVEMIRAQKS